jgi:hypothetical protein
MVRFRFKVRTLLVSTLIVACSFAYVGFALRRTQIEIAALADFDELGSVTGSEVSISVERESLIDRLLGSETIELLSIAGTKEDGEISDVQLMLLCKLTSLETLLTDVPISLKPIAQKARMKRLKKVEFYWLDFEKVLVSLNSLNCVVDHPVNVVIWFEPFNEDQVSQLKLIPVVDNIRFGDDVEGDMDYSQ